jgi:hypothetical protein
LLRKFAAADILEAQMGEDAGFSKSAHRAVFEYTPRAGYLYVRSRAISSRCNDNFDMFPAPEIEKSYQTFLGKPVFVNHHNEDHRRSRGVIIDAALHKDLNPDGSPDTWAELLHEIDAIKFPRLARAILKKEVNRTSMGCDVQFSKCSVCENVATSPLEYCSHIPGKKGKRIYRVTESGEREGRLVFEICSGLSFFENSLLVEQPADPTAYFLGEIESGPGLESLKASISKTSSKSDQMVPILSRTSEHKTELIGWSEPRMEPAVIDHGVWTLIHEAVRTNDDSLDRLTTLATVEEESSWETLDWHRTGNVQPPSNSLRRQSQLNETNPQPPLVRPAQKRDDRGRPIPYTKEENSDWYKQTKAHADEWAKRNPIHPQNIVDHWNAASPEEKDHGMSWYADAHHTTKILAEGTNTPLHTMAGLVANYSPQTHWATNVITAAKSARLKAGLGGPANHHGFSQYPEGHPRAGETRGIMASTGQKENAEKLLQAPEDEDEARSNGTHYENVFTGPKIKSFARLIHSGGDDHSVVVDRHAYSVASGARASDAAYGHSGLGKNKRYRELEDVYRAAAAHISNHEGTTVHPHQVQAVTWLVRQRLNEQGDQALARKGRTSAVAARRSITEMHQYMGEHHPEASQQMPGTGYSKETGLVAGGTGSNKKTAYRETKAPQDVDTLRSENCTVCGNSTAFDGKQCQVCGYVAPPKPFGDPNTDIARANDLRKQVLDGDEADPMQNEEMGNQQGDPGELEEQQEDAEAGLDDSLGMLTCNNCGTGVQPAAPASDGGEPPYPADGDVCPVCKKGQLLSDSDEDSEEGDEDQDKDGIPDKDEDEDQDGIPDDEEDSEEDEDSDNDQTDKKKVPKK